MRCGSHPIESGNRKRHRCCIVCRRVFVQAGEEPRTELSGTPDPARTLSEKCFAIVSSLLTIDEFPAGSAHCNSNQWRPRRGRWLIRSYGRGLKSGLLSRCSLRQMTQSVTFDEAIEFLGEILSVVAGTAPAPAPSTGHQAQRSFSGHCQPGAAETERDRCGRVPRRYGAPARVFQVERNKSPMDVFQHVPHNGRHLDKCRTSLPGSDRCAPARAARPHDEIRWFEVGDALQAS